MNKEQRNLLHSVIAHGATSLREKKLILEGELMRLQKYYTVGKDDFEAATIRSLEAEIAEIVSKLDIAQEAMAELEGERKLSEIFGQDATQIFMKGEETSVE